MLVTRKYRFLKVFVVSVLPHDEVWAWTNIILTNFSFDLKFYHTFYSFKFFLQHETHLSRETIIFQYSRRNYILNKPIMTFLDHLPLGLTTPFKVYMRFFCMVVYHECLTFVPNYSTVNLFMLKFKSGQTLFEEKLTFDLLVCAK